MTVSSDPDLGELIRTKNRYRITTIAEKDEKFATPEGELRYRKLKIAEADSMRPIFEKYQPGVFASDGIPVVIKNENVGAERYDYDVLSRLPAVGVFICTAGLLPWCESEELRRTYVVVSVDGQRVDQRVVVEVNNLHTTNTLPFFKWVWLALQEESEVVDGHRSFVACFPDYAQSQVVWWSIWNGSRDHAMRALVYAIAARLKKLEDENRVRGGAK